VVSANDRMTGFSAPGGVLTKTRLLTLEGAELLSE
jgi:methylated-DNA-[protein]-cysteine S-methyltransferase